jgi:anti-sigma factor RsiW
MNCRHAELQRMAYLDGDLPRPLRAQVEGHLRHCASCRAAYDDTAQFDRLLRAALACPATPYRFAVLQARLWEVSPLDEVRAFLPSLRAPGRAPRWAFAAIMLLLGLLAQGPAGAMRLAARGDEAMMQYRGRLDSALRATTDVAAPLPDEPRERRRA